MRSPDTVIKMNFIKSAERLIEIQKSLAENAKNTKEMRKEKSALTKEVLEYMIQHNIDDHVHDGYEIVKSEREVKSKLSIEMIEGMLENFEGEELDQEKIERIVNAIVEAESTDEKKTVLAIKKKRQPKPKKSIDDS
jgi:hypothetical protein